jgi:RNA polymerase sigma-70 factor (ECF subfamily)
MGLTVYMLTDPDIDLMLSFKQGDQRAFRLLFDKYKKRVINFCYRYCRHRSVAEDLAQETFLRVYKAAARYRPDARFSTWLFKIAANVCLNEIRKPVYRARLESIDQTGQQGPGAAREIVMAPEQSRPDVLLENHQHQVLIQQAMGRLPEEQRAALLLRATEGFSYQQIGRQINRSENHVKTLIHRGRQRMKQLLGAYWGKHAS